MPALAATFTDYVLAVHILGVVIAFGATFAYPVIFASARRADPSVMPWLFSVMQRIDRFIVNPGLTLVLIAGIVLASKFHVWSEFYVQWGLASVVVIGAGVGAFMIPREGKLAKVAQRDLEAAPVGGGGGSPWSPEYDKLLRQVSVGGLVLDLIVIVTIFLMATHA
jgi:uncharacterized membrane protein